MAETLASLQMAATQAELTQLRQAREAAADELEAAKAENRELLQRAALAASLSAEADALRHQVCATEKPYAIPSSNLQNPIS
jgi:hypothetical protein